MAKSFSSLLFIVSLFIACQASLGQSVEFDISRLNELLKSKLFDELREAHKIVRHHPETSIEFFDVVAARADHPELAHILATMLTRMQADELRLQWSKARPTVKQLITVELVRRGLSIKDAMPQEGTVSDSSLASGPVTHSVSGFLNDLVLGESKPSPPETQEFSFYEIKEKNSRQIKLSDDELRFVFRELDAERDFADNDQSARRFHVPHILLRNRDASEKLARLLIFDPSVNHPVRLVPYLFHSLPVDHKIIDRVYELTYVNKHQDAVAAVRCFERFYRLDVETSVIDEIAVRFLNRTGVSERLLKECNKVLIKLLPKTSESVQKLIRKQLAKKR